jgi:hypothetical protein
MQNNSSSELSNTPGKNQENNQSSWINKLLFEYEEDPEGGGTIRITWDETDPDLANWNAWDENVQRQFITNALNIAVSNTLTKNEA